VIRAFLFEDPEDDAEQLRGRGHNRFLVAFLPCYPRIEFGDRTVGFVSDVDTGALAHDPAEVAASGLRYRPMVRLSA